MTILHHFIDLYTPSAPRFSHISRWSSQLPLSFECATKDLLNYEFAARSIASRFPDHNLQVFAALGHCFMAHHAVGGWFSGTSFAAPVVRVSRADDGVGEMLLQKSHER